MAARRVVPSWPGWGRLPREARDTLFLLGVIAWTVLPHASHLPTWAIVLTAIVLVWRGRLALANAALPGRWVIIAVLIVAIGLTYWSYRTLLGKEPGVTLAVALMALKTLELRARRDAFVVFFLGFFLILTHFLYSQSLPVAFAMLVLLVIAWPFSLAATQLLAADIYAGRNPTLGDLLSRAKPLWTRMFVLGLIVYGSYLLWTVIPFLVALSLATGAASVSGLLLMLSLLIFTAYMVARLFINFLFWEQAGALGGGAAIEALQESKDLARSGTDRPRAQRPLYRGAMIASLWLLVIIAANVAIEFPVVLFRMRGVTSLEQAATMVQAMATKNSPDLLSGLTTLLSCLVHAVLRPWLAAIFVVLYLDTKAEQQRPR
jgi:hypothetical protein